MGESDGIQVKPVSGTFALNSLILAKGVAGETAVTIQGLRGGSVVATRAMVLSDNKPAANQGHYAEFFGNWINLDEIRIVNTSGNTNFDIEV